MAIYMPPLLRKKQVQGRYNPDSFRVISSFAEENHQKYEREHTENISEWRKKWRENDGLALPDIYNRKTEVLPHEAPDYRINKPHPGSCGFLRHNVRSLNEPICTVFTEVTRAEQQNWWPSRISTEPLHVPPQTKDTIYRADYQEREKAFASFGSTRHTANPNKEPALGTVPVNFLRTQDGKQRFFKEKVSYEHQYNSRHSDNYPIRGKRQGSFVWNKMNEDASKKLIDYYKIITAEEGVAKQQKMEAEQKIIEPTEKSEMLTEAQTFATPLVKDEQVVEQATIESLLKEQLSSSKDEQTEPLPVQSTEQTAEKTASPPGSKKTSAKNSPQHSPKQKASPKSSPKQSPKHSRTNSCTAVNQNKSPTKSPEGNNTNIVGEATLITSNTVSNHSPNIVDQHKTVEKEID